MRTDEEEVSVLLDIPRGYQRVPPLGMEDYVTAFRCRNQLNSEHRKLYGLRRFYRRILHAKACFSIVKTSWFC